MHKFFKSMAAPLADFVVRIWRQLSCLSIESKQEDPHAEEFCEFFVTEDADFRGGNWKTVDDESDRDLTDY